MTTTILTITGSDCTGLSGIQGDVATITSLGAHAATAITAITVQGTESIQRIYDVDADVVEEQVNTALTTCHPAAVKIGMVRSVDAVHRLARLLSQHKNIVLDPGILTARGATLMPDDVVQAVRTHLLPLTTLLVMRCAEAELLLSVHIATTDDMLYAAQRLHEMGAKAVLLRGGNIVNGQLTAVYYDHEAHEFFTTHNTEMWQTHGVGSSLATAIAVYLAAGRMGYYAVKAAHDFIHTRVVYAVKADEASARPADLYNKFAALVAQHYTTEHDVQFYADQLSITPRYLDTITRQTVGRTPKQTITDYVMNEACALLQNTTLTVQQIAYKLGFTSSASFSAFFSKRGMGSPMTYRMDHR